MSYPTQEYLQITANGFEKNVPTKEVIDSILATGVDISSNVDTSDSSIDEITQILNYIYSTTTVEDALTWTNPAKYCYFVGPSHPSIALDFPCYVIKVFDFRYKAPREIKPYFTRFCQIYSYNRLLKNNEDALNVQVYAGYIVNNALTSPTLYYQFDNSGITIGSSKIQPLPTVTASDSGKFLRVNTEGKWIADTVPSAEEASF